MPYVCHIIIVLHIYVYKVPIELACTEYSMYVFVMMSL